MKSVRAQIVSRKDRRGGASLSEACTGNRHKPGTLDQTRRHTNDNQLPGGSTCILLHSLHKTSASARIVLSLSLTECEVQSERRLQTHQGRRLSESRSPTAERSNILDSSPAPSPPKDDDKGFHHCTDASSLQKAELYVRVASSVHAAA